MSTLLTNIRRASAPLQEQTQQIGMRARQLLVSAGSAMSSADLGAIESQVLLTRGVDSKPHAGARAGALHPSEPASAPSHETSSSVRGRPPLTRSPRMKPTSSEEVGETTTEPTSSSSSRHALTDTERTGSSVSLHPPSPSMHGSETGALMKSVPGSPCSNSSSPSSAAQVQSTSQELPSVAKPPPPDQPVPWRGMGSDDGSDRVVVCNSRALPHLFTRIRDRNTPPQRFKFFARRLVTILVEEAIACLESSRPFITTPTGATFSSVFVDESRVCVVSIMRAGDALADAAQACLPQAPVGKVLVQRDDESETKHAVMFYTKLPPMINEMQVLLCDPMLATGSSAKMVIQTLLDAGVRQPNIVFVTVVVCPEGLASVRGAYPEVKIVTGAVDDCLDERRYIVPGLGDFGDRFFGTVR